MSQKVCPTCHQTKDVNKNNFIRSKLHDVDGFSFDCRSCHVQKFLEAERALVLSHPNFDVSSKRNEKKVSTKKSAEKKAEIDRLLDEGLKKCSHCHQVKDVSEFGLNEKTYSGLTSQCKQCNAELCKKRRNMKKVANEAK